MPQSFLYVRSQDRILGTSSAFKVTLPNVYKNITGMVVVGAELPFSMYNLDGIYVQGVTFTYNGTPFVVVVPAGYYQIGDLQTWLLTALQTALPAAGATSVIYTATSGALSVLFSGAQPFSVQGTTSGSLGRILGCDPLNAATYGVAGVLTFPCVATLSPVTTLFLQIAEIPSVLTSTNNMQAFARIQLSAAPGSIVMANSGGSVYNNNTYLTPISTLSSLTCTLYTPDGTLVNLHGVEWAFTILIQSN